MADRERGNFWSLSKATFFYLGDYDHILQWLCGYSLHKFGVLGHCEWFDYPLCLPTLITFALGKYGLVIFLGIVMQQE